MCLTLTHFQINSGGGHIFYWKLFYMKELNRKYWSQPLRHIHFIYNWIITACTGHIETPATAFLLDGLYQDLVPTHMTFFSNFSYSMICSTFWRERKHQPYRPSFREGFLKTKQLWVSTHEGRHSYKIGPVWCGWTFTHWEMSSNSKKYFLIKRYRVHS